MYSQSHIIKLSLTYLTNTITISISKSKLLSEVKDRAYKLFFPIKGRIVLTYMGKELTVHEGKQISAIFKDLKKASITIKVPSLNITTQKRLFDAKDEKANTIQSHKEKSLPSLSNSHIIPRKKALISPTRYSSLNSNNKLLCFDCCEERSSFFCRNCNMFLCPFCRNNKRTGHGLHEVLEVNVDDLKKCADDYNSILIDDLNKVKADFLKIKQIKQKSNSNINWKDVIENQIDRFVMVSEELNNFVPKVDMRNISSNIVHTSEFEKEHAEATLLLEAITCSPDTDPFELFLKINYVEKEVAKLFEDVKLLNQYNTVQKKIVNYYKELEEEIDRLIIQTNKQHLIDEI